MCVCVCDAGEGQAVRTVAVELLAVVLVLVLAKRTPVRWIAYTLSKQRRLWVAIGWQECRC